jgi:hypothetical protein
VPSAQGLPRQRAVLHQRVPKLFADLALARGDRRYTWIMCSLNGARLLIYADESRRRGLRARIGSVGPAARKPTFPLVYWPG